MLLKLISWQCYLFSLLIATTSAAVTTLRHIKKNSEVLDSRVENIVEHSLGTDAVDPKSSTITSTISVFQSPTSRKQSPFTQTSSVYDSCSVQPQQTAATQPNATVFLTYGSALNIVKTAWLAMGNGVGFEIFEFVDPKYEGPTAPTDSFEYLYTRGGMFHLSVTDPDPASLLTKVVAAGGKQIGEVLDLGNGDAAVYMMDPWGNIIESMSITFEMLMSNRG